MIIIIYKEENQKLKLMKIKSNNNDQFTKDIKNTFNKEDRDAIAFIGVKGETHSQFKYGTSNIGKMRDGDCYYVELKLIGEKYIEEPIISIKFSVLNQQYTVLDVKYVFIN